MAARQEVYKFGFSQLIMAKRTYADSTATYSDAFQCGQATNGTITPNYVTGALYGDDAMVAEVSEFVSAGVTLGSTTMPSSAPAVLFGHEVDETSGEETSNTGDTANEVGVGFTTKNHDGTYDACVLYRVKFQEGAENFQTKGSSINFVTPVLNGTALGRQEDGDWRIKSFAFASESAAVDWIETTLGITL